MIKCKKIYLGLAITAFLGGNIVKSAAQRGGPIAQENYGIRLIQLRLNHQLKELDRIRFLKIPDWKIHTSELLNSLKKFKNEFN